CAHYVGDYTASVTDVGMNKPFMAMVSITADDAGCTVAGNGIPNHDFNDGGAFATPVAEVMESYHVTRTPSDAAAPTGLTLERDNAIMRNGVKLDLLAAACYGVGPDPLGQEKIGCMSSDIPWRYDPMTNFFGTDGHNAHTQPDGGYHYHGDPKAMVDQSGATVSGLIGWAADGYPIYGPYFDDNGTIRKAKSGFTLKQGARTNQPGEGAFPGGSYDGTFIDDYEFTGAGDLDECNGMSVDGVYGYYVTDSYPWVIRCFKGTPDASFNKSMP
ncbi:MAG: YHYH protein, partial [Myxococcales bacterium]|nr:YHYH protein [Myxococcales bacterium]